MSISLKRLERKKLDAGMNKLGDVGIDVERWLAMLDADWVAMQRLVIAWPGSPEVMPYTSKAPGIVYDADTVSRTLGLPTECHDPVPEAADGEIVIYYGGWELRDFEGCAASERVIPISSAASELRDTIWKVKPGYYRLLLPVVGSCEKKWEQQVQHLFTIDQIAQPAPVCVATTALLVHLVKTCEDPLNGGRCRCREVRCSSDWHFRQVVGVRDGRILLQGFAKDKDAKGDLWLSAIREL